MPNPTDGFLEITLSGSYFGTPWANIFHYWNPSNAPITNMVAIATEFDNFVAEEMANFTSENVDYELITVKDVLGLNNDVTAVPIAPIGLKTGESVAAFTAIKFSLDVTNKETRKGAKRIIGVAEGSQSGGYLTAAALVEAQAFENNLYEALNVGGVVYLPVVKGGPTIADPTRLVVNPIINATAQSLLTSQVSRK